MAPWIWILIVAALVLLVAGGRFGGPFGGRVMGHWRGNRRDVHPKPVIDADSVPAMADALINPVSNLHLAPSPANSSVYQGQVYFFLSAKDRDTFEASPDPSINTFVRGARAHD